MTIRRVWEWLRNRFPWNPRPRWPRPAIDQEHQNYRNQYEALLPTLPHLPRGDHFEERNAYLYLAELLVGLHNRGDDPIMPPGIRRIVIREAGASPATLGVARFGDFSPVRAILGGWQSWALIGAVTLSGWGMAALQAGLKENIENERDRARANVAVEHANWLAAQHSEQLLRDNLNAANERADQSAANWEAERRNNARLAARNRSNRRAAENVLAGRGPPNWVSGMRDDEPPAPEPVTAPAAAAPAGDSSRMPN